MCFTESLKFRICIIIWHIWENMSQNFFKKLQNDWKENHSCCPCSVYFYWSVFHIYFMYSKSFLQTQGIRTGWTRWYCILMRAQLRFKPVSARYYWAMLISYLAGADLWSNQKDIQDTQTKGRTPTRAYSNKPFIFAYIENWILRNKWWYFKF